VGYTPIFDSVFQGSLCGKWPDIGIWALMLAMQDKNGEIDAHPTYISTVTGCPVGEVEECIARFCQPDPSSRTPDQDGRRLIPIPGRGFGWTVVNHRKYREKARKASFDAARSADGRNAERMRERADPRSPAPTRADPPSDSNADSNTNSEKTKKPAKRAACQFPDDLELTEADKAFATDRLTNVDVPEMFIAFRDFHVGKGTLAKDWHATWRTWVQNAKSFGYPMLPTAPKVPEKVVRYDARGRVIQ
jgi:hypothetical protein